MTQATPMRIFSNSDFTLGILGGGQLGKMLLYDTRKYDIRTAVLDPAADAPGRLAANSFTQGSLTDFDTVYQFGKTCNAITIEIENVNVDALERLESEGIAVHPTPSVLRIIQSKIQQKEFFRDNNLPTAPFQVFENKAAILAAVANGERSFPFVWKIAKGGYDGFGVSVIRFASDLTALPDAPCITEELVPFAKELAVVVCRNPSGDVKAFPTVEMEFHPTANQVEYVLCPAQIEDKLKLRAEQTAIRVAEAFGICGLLAVEMFLTTAGELLVNEVAPRPHNSGHLTIEACYTNQFEQHLRGVLNLPLGSTALKTAGVMANLVGAEGYTGPVVYEGYETLLGIDGVNIHIYGKSETRPFRKMGHVTTIGNDLATARALAQQAKNNIKVISK